MFSKCLLTIEMVLTKTYTLYKQIVFVWIPAHNNDILSNNAMWNNRATYHKFHQTIYCFSYDQNLDTKAEERFFVRAGTLWFQQEKIIINIKEKNSTSNILHPFRSYIVNQIISSDLPKTSVRSAPSVKFQSPFPTSF